MKDAKDALSLDPGYSKAYARMGFAYLNMNKLTEAEDAYSNALRLDPSNQSYKDNLEAVKEKINAGPNVMSQGMFPITSTCAILPRYCYWYVQLDNSN